MDFLEFFDKSGEFNPGTSWSGDNPQFILFMYKKNKSRPVASRTASIGGSARKEDRKRNSGFKSGGDAAFNASKDSSARTDKRNQSRKQKPLYVVIRRFKHVFAAYDEQQQNTQTKRLALNLAVGMSRDYYPDRFRFWQDLRDEANILLDSKRFEAACEKWGLKPQAVAEHLVVEGKATINNVLKNGLESYGEKARMFHEPLYLDTRGLYGEPAHE